MFGLKMVLSFSSGQMLAKIIGAGHMAKKL